MGFRNSNQPVRTHLPSFLCFYDRAFAVQLVPCSTGNPSLELEANPSYLVAWFLPAWHRCPGEALFRRGQLWEGKMFTDVLASFYVNLTKARFILEEGISIEKNVPNRLAGGAFS